MIHNKSYGTLAKSRCCWYIPHLPARLELARRRPPSGVLLADEELRALRQDNRADRPNPAASGGAPTPCVRVSDTGRRNTRPSGAGPCRGESRRARPADGILQNKEERELEYNQETGYSMQKAPYGALVLQESFNKNPNINCSRFRQVIPPYAAQLARTLNRKCRRRVKGTTTSITQRCR